MKGFLAELLPRRVREAIRRFRAKRLARLRAGGELEAALRALLFPELPSVEGRVELLSELFGTGPSEAMYLLATLHRSLTLDGAVCEFGVAQGATSALLANELKATEKHLWLFDSFKGLPAPTEKDVLINDIFGLTSMAAYEGKMQCDAREVRRRIAATGFPEKRLHVVAGYLEEARDFPSSICFAYIDLDLYRPIVTALRIVEERLLPGGTIVVDDYGFFSTGAQAAVDEFVRQRGQSYEIEHPHQFAGHFVILRKRAITA